MYNNAMNGKILKLALIPIVILALGGYLFINRETIKNISNISFEFVEKNISRRVNTAEPLRKDSDDENSFLSIKGVIEETNKRRTEQGVSVLEESEQLNISAQRKVDDMFKKQYFEHDSPTGQGAGDLVEESGYEFVVVGENLALGNYKDDAVLVQAWMDSPGHRENILKPSYTQIGVAVARGTFEGKETWLAVQHFAKPVSACPTINEENKGKIDSNNRELDAKKVELDSKKRELEDKPENHEESVEYNKKVDEYNNLVTEYNKLLAETKDLVAQYNQEVQNFNNCAKE